MGNATALQQDTATSHTILIVEDNEEIGTTLETLLLAEFEIGVVRAYNGWQASRIVHTLPVDLILLDYHLPDTNGIQLYDLWQHYYDLLGVPVIMISANPPYEELEKRHLLNLRKPFDLDNVLDAVERALTTEQRIVRRRVY